MTEETYYTVQIGGKGKVPEFTSTTGGLTTLYSEAQKYPSRVLAIGAAKQFHIENNQWVKVFVGSSTGIIDLVAEFDEPTSVKSDWCYIIRDTISKLDMSSGILLNVSESEANDICEKIAKLHSSNCTYVLQIRI